MNKSNSGPLGNTNAECPQETDQESFPILKNACHKKEKDENTQTGIGQNKGQQFNRFVSKTESYHL
jgi:hypothetical protein